MFVKCINCGKIILEDKLCIFCGYEQANSLTSSKEIENDVQSKTYKYIESKILDRKYDEAISYSLEKTSISKTTSYGFFLRLLSKNKCTTVIELICKGFQFETDSDLFNTIKYATIPEEKEFYNNVISITQNLKKKLKECIYQNKKDEKRNTKICEVYKNTLEYFNNIKGNIFKLINDIEEIEEKICLIEMDSRIIRKEYNYTLWDAARNTNTLLDDLSNGKDMSLYDFTESLQKYYVKIDSNVMMSEDTVKVLENISIKNNLLKKFRELIISRSKIVKKIDTELTILKNKNNEFQELIEKNDMIEKKYAYALDCLNKNDFLKAINILGKKKYNNLLNEVGIAVECPECIFLESENSIKNINSSTSKIIEDKPNTNSDLDYDDDMEMSEGYGVYFNLAQEVYKI